MHPDYTPPPARAQSSRRYFSLDVVRAVAACSVALGHMQAFLPAPTNNVFEQGLLFCNQSFVDLLVGKGKMSAHPGVIIFIVLSGFCVHLPLARNPADAHHHGFWREYFARRFIRIVPVYWWGCLLGVVSVLLAQSSASGSPYWLGTTSIDGLSLVRKFLFIDPVLPGAAVGLGNPAIRSVATELWLYCLYPLTLLWVLGRRTQSALLRIAVAYGLSGVFLVLPPGPAWAYESVPRFLVWWLLGAVAAEEVERDSRGAILRYVYCFGISAIVLIAFNLTPNFRGSYLITVPLLAFATAAGIVLMIKVEQLSDSGPGVVSRFLAYIGERSYSLYAVHMPLLVTMFVLNRWQPWAELHRRFGSVLCILVLVVGTWVTYTMVEKPSHRWSRLMKVRGSSSKREAAVI